MASHSPSCSQTGFPVHLSMPTRCQRCHRTPHLEHLHLGPHLLSKASNNHSSSPNLLGKVPTTHFNRMEHLPHPRVQDSQTRSRRNSHSNWSLRPLGVWTRAAFCHCTVLILRLQCLLSPSSMQPSQAQRQAQSHNFPTHSTLLRNLSLDSIQPHSLALEASPMALGIHSTALRPLLQQPQQLQQVQALPLRLV